MIPCSWPLPEDLALELAEYARLAAERICRLVQANDRLDIAQDAFAALVAHVRRGIAIANAPAWLTRVVGNQYAMRCRVVRRAAAIASLSPADGTDERPSVLEPACRADAWAVFMRDYADELRRLSVDELDAVLELAAGSGQKIASCLKKKLRNVLSPRRAKQRRN